MGGIAYVGTFDGDGFYGIDLRSGASKGELRKAKGPEGEPLGRIWSSPAIDVENRRVYVGNSNGYLYAWSTENGFHLAGWPIERGDDVCGDKCAAHRPEGHRPCPVNSSPAVVAGGDGKLYARNGETGAVKWVTPVFGAYLNPR